jgi:hypothetical protein
MLRIAKFALLMCSLCITSFAATSTFPFDTVLTGLAKVLPNNLIGPQDTLITVVRYNLNFHFGHLSSSLVCCPATVCEDFRLSHPVGGVSDNRYPMGSTVPSEENCLMTGEEYPNVCIDIPCPSSIKVNESYKTHEYRFPLSSGMLYMKVIEVYGTDSLKVRFDTSSFLPTSKICNAPATKSASRIGLTWENGFATVQGIRVGENCKISIYDLAGKKLFESATMENRKIAVTNLVAKGIFVIRISAGNKELFTKKYLMK